MRAEETRRTYTRELKHTANVWCAEVVDDVSKGTVREEFLRLKRTRGHRAAGRWLAANSALWTWMVDNEVTDRHPFRGTEKLRKESAAKPSDRWLDDDEIALLFRRLSRLPADRALALRIMLATGLWSSEVLAGRWEELDRNSRC